MKIVWDRTSGIRERPVDGWFRLCAALMGSMALWRACWLLWNYGQSQPHHPWAIAGYLFWAILWLWPAVTGYVPPQWRSSLHRPRRG